MTIEPICKGRDVFGGLPEVAPAVAFTGPNDEVRVRSAGVASPCDEALRLLERHNIITITVDDQRRGQLLGHVIDRREVATELFASLGRESQRTKRAL